MATSPSSATSADGSDVESVRKHAGQVRESDTGWCTGAAHSSHDPSTGRAGPLRYQGAYGGVGDHGFKELDDALSQLPVTADPITDLAVEALTCRRVARENPHLYDLMFGLSTRATYRPLRDTDIRFSGRSPAFQAAYAHIAEACERL